MVVIGNIGGKLKTGPLRRLPRLRRSKGHRTTANMYVTLLQLAGSQRDSVRHGRPRVERF